MLLLRLSQAKHHRRLFNAAAAFVGAWTVASIFTVALQCNLVKPWIIVGEHCPGSVKYSTIRKLFGDKLADILILQFLRWQVISAFDIAIEMALFGLTVYLVWGLKTSIENKAVVVGAFAFRLP